MPESVWSISEIMLRRKTEFPRNKKICTAMSSGVPRGGGGVQSRTPPPEIPKAPQNRPKPNPPVKTFKNGWI